MQNVYTIYKELSIGTELKKYTLLNDAGLTFPVYNRVPYFVREGKNVRLYGFAAEGSVITGKAVSFNFTDGSDISFVLSAEGFYFPVANTDNAGQDEVSVEEKTTTTNTQGKTQGKTEGSTEPSKEEKASNEENDIMKMISDKFKLLSANKEIRDNALKGAVIGLVGGFILSKIIGTFKLPIIIGGTVIGAAIGFKQNTEDVSNVTSDIDQTTAVQMTEEAVKKVEAVAKKFGKNYDQATIESFKEWYLQCPHADKLALNDILNVLNRIAENKPKFVKAKSKKGYRLYVIDEFSKLAKVHSPKMLNRLKNEMELKNIKFNY